MIRRETENYNLSSEVDLTRELDFAATFNTYQEYFNLIFGVEGIKSNINSEVLNLNLENVLKINVTLKKVDKV